MLPQECCRRRAVPCGLSNLTAWAGPVHASPSVFAMPVFTLAVQMWLMRFSCSGLARTTILMFQRVWMAICRNGKCRGYVSVNTCQAALWLQPSWLLWLHFYRNFLPVLRIYFQSFKSMLEGRTLLFSSPFFLVNLWIILLAQNSFPITVRVSFPDMLRFVSWHHWNPGMSQAGLNKVHFLFRLCLCTVTSYFESAIA